MIEQAVLYWAGFVSGLAVGATLATLWWLQRRQM